MQVYLWYFLTSSTGSLLEFISSHFSLTDMSARLISVFSLRMVSKHDFQISVCSSTWMTPFHLLSVFSHLFVVTDFCESNPCQNEGSCVKKIGAYTCNCEAGCTGDNCETGKFEYHVTCNIDACCRFHNGWKGIRLAKYILNPTINPDKHIGCSPQDLRHSPSLRCFADM